MISRVWDKSSEVKAQPGSKRGYALPLVMLLALVGGLVATMIIEFQGREHLAEQRQIETYREHHEQQGLAECIEMIQRFGRRQPSSAAAAAKESGPRDDGPTGFTMRGPGGEFYLIEITDAQGLLLDQPGVPVDSEDDTAIVFAHAAELLRSVEAKPERYLRSHGPPLVDVNSAPRAVLEALIRAVDDRAQVEGFATQVLTQRAEKKLTPADLRKIIADSEVSDQDSIELLAGLFVYGSVLSQVDVLVRDPVRHVVARHTGFLVGDPRSSGSHPYTFLSWKRVLETDQGQETIVRDR